MLLENIDDFFAEWNYIIICISYVIFLLIIPGMNLFAVRKYYQCTCVQYKMKPSNRKRYSNVVIPMIIMVNIILYPINWINGDKYLVIYGIFFSGLFFCIDTLFKYGSYRKKIYFFLSQARKCRKKGLRRINCELMLFKADSELKIPKRMLAFAVCILIYAFLQVFDESYKLQIGDSISSILFNILTNQPLEYVLLMLAFLLSYLIFHIRDYWEIGTRKYILEMTVEKDSSIIKK